MSKSSNRYWLLHSPLSRNEVAGLLGTVSFENEWIAEVPYPVEGWNVGEHYTVKVRPNGHYWDSELLGQLETTHNVHALVAREEHEAIFGRIHAGVTADLIEHPAIVAGVYCDTMVGSYLAWGERVELLSQDLFAKPRPDAEQERIIERFLPVLERRERTVVDPLVAELKSRGIEYTHREVPFPTV